jgi:hypothetical protein
MDAIYYKNGVIRPVVAVITGAAVGCKGPIIQVGSAIGSTLGMALWQRITLVAAGAGAGRLRLQHADRRRDVRHRRCVVALCLCAQNSVSRKQRFQFEETRFEFQTEG